VLRGVYRIVSPLFQPRTPFAIKAAIVDKNQRLCNIFPSKEQRKPSQLKNNYNGLSTTATRGCIEVAVMGTYGCNMTPLLGGND